MGQWVLVDPLDYPSDEIRVKFEQIDQMNAQRRMTQGKPDATYYAQDWYRHRAVDELKTLELPYYEFIQNQGDSIFIPDFWAHATVDLCHATVGVELMGVTVTGGF